MLENPDFKQDHYSRKAESVYKNGHESLRLMEWSTFYDTYF